MTYPQDPWQQPSAQGNPTYRPPNPFSAPPVPEHELTLPRRPGTVEAAFWISVVLPVVYTALSAVSYLLLQGWMRTEAGGEVPAPGRLGDQIDQTINGMMLAFLAIAGLFFVMLTVLWIVFGFKMRAGRNWARVTLLVLGAIWAMSCLSSLAAGALGTFDTRLDPGGGLPGSYAALSYLQSGIALIGLAAFAILALLKPSNDYFQAFQRRY